MKSIQKNSSNFNFGVASRQKLNPVGTLKWKIPSSFQKCLDKKEK